MGGGAEDATPAMPAATLTSGSHLVRDARSAVRPQASLRPSLRSLGPGLIAAGSDNDPTTVATMVVAGATTTYSLSWLTLLLYPMLAGVLVIAARVGLATRSGLITTVKRRYGRWSRLLLVSVLVVNLITLAADFEAGAAALGLLLGVDLRWLIALYAALVTALLLFGSRRGVQRVIKYSIALFAAYLFAAVMAHPDWPAVMRATLLPSISLRADYVEAALAILGTTLTSYCYVWQVRQHAEKDGSAGGVLQARLDAALGMLVAVATFWFILIATGATLGVHHHQVATAQEAGAALEPLAGPFASRLFALGLLASSLVAIPVLASTSAYVLGEEFEWARGPDGAGQPPSFYVATLLTVLAGAGVSLIGLPPIQLLYWASIAGALPTPLGLVLLLLVAADPRAMGSCPVRWPMLALGWGTTGLVTAVGAFYIAQQVVATLPLHALQMLISRGSA